MCKPVNIVVILLATGLVACNQDVPQAVHQQVDMDQADKEHTLSTSSSELTRQGPHGSYDPHVNLTPEQHMSVALQHYAEGRGIEAMDVLNKAIQQFSKHAGLLAVRSSILMETDKVSEALLDLESAIRLEPDNPATLTNRAQIYRQFGRISEAVADLNKAIEISPDFIAARFNRGAIHFSSNEFRKALDDFDHCIKFDAKTAAAYFNRSATHAELGDMQKALSDMKKFISLTDNDKWKQQAQKLMESWQAKAEKS